MPSLLYIGHSYHNKTKSTQFLQELFKTKYTVTVFDYDPYKDNNDAYKALSGRHFDIVVCFQVLPNRKILNENVSFLYGVFFPMYDAGPARDNPIWKDYSDFQIINFSRTMHEELLRMGMSSRYVQYFPKPIETHDDGKVASVFFWQRLGHININTVTALFEQAPVEHIHIHKALDPGEEFTPLPLSWENKTSLSEWFPTKSDLYQKIEESALYVAPREYEGIGMSFLEAMAMGRCVVAIDNPTMNEYIEHGKTGYLYDLHKITPLSYSAEEIRTIQAQTRAYIRSGYAEWEEKKWKILDWLEEERTADSAAVKKWFVSPPNRITYFIFGIPMAQKYTQETGWELDIPCKKLPLVRIRKNTSKFTLDLCKVNIFKIKFI